ncbi:MAG TPA: BamA/TamA family outer membrane protein [Longimicrobiales bacterium]|nr:BamA/TamA family outer membrane protein [Longimicrobiales bacterium]
MACLAPIAAGLFLCLPATAQDADQDSLAAGSPRVERIRFPGAESLDAGDLATRIRTEETRCRVWLLRPLCAITDWRLIHIRRYLDAEELAADEDRLHVYYFQRGFRHATVNTRLAPRGRGVEVIFEVEEGPPTLVESLDVVQTRDAVSARQIRRADLPREGERLDLVRLTDGVIRLTDRLGRGGWLDGAVHDTVDVSADGLRAAVRVAIDPGPRSTLGGLEVVGNERVTERTIADGLRLRQGRTLRLQDLVASQRSLYESNLFHEARVRVPAQTDSAKVVEVTVREAPPQSARIGGGLNTMEFVQAEARYTNYNFFGGGRRVEVRGTVGNLLADELSGRGIFRNVRRENAGGLDPDAFTRPTWLASIDLIQPSFRSASNTLGLAVFTHRRIVPGIVIDRGIGAELSATRRLDYQTPVTIAYRYELAALDAGELYFCVNYGICDLPTVAVLQERQRLSPVQASFIADKGNDPIAPTDGYRIRVNAEHASGMTMSDFAHHRLSADASLYYPLDVHRRRVLAGRLRLGAVRPLDGAAGTGLLGDDDGTDLGRVLHPRRRFYAGGARSVRGYTENQLGPRVLTVSPEALLDDGAGCAEAQILDGSCDPNMLPIAVFHPRPVGGRNVIEASVEYRFPLRANIQAAVFVDGARVGGPGGSVPGGAVAAVTPGAGVRFESPVGPIRVDLGVRPLVKEELRVVTEMRDDDGTARLVPLALPRTYDPLGGRSFLRQVLGRLTLHLSIGEAF